MRWLRVLSLPGFGDCLWSDPAPIVNTCSPQGNEGVVSIRWTIDGVEPSATSCSGIARLQLRVTSSCNDGVISPIPCDLSKVRFDAQPEGDLSLLLEAIGPSEELVASGSASYYARSTAPSTPLLIGLW